MMVLVVEVGEFGLKGFAADRNDEFAIRLLVVQRQPQRLFLRFKPRCLAFRIPLLRLAANLNSTGVELTTILMVIVPTSIGTAFSCAPSRM